MPAAAETAGRPVHAVLEDYLRKGGFQYARRMGVPRFTWHHSAPSVPVLSLPQVW